MNKKHSGQQSKHDEVDYKKVAEQLAEENAALNEQLLRERADAANVRRRSEEEKLGLGSFHKASIVRELLPIIDNFERALKNVPKDLEKNDYIKGVQSVVKQFEATLNKLGVTRIPTVGHEFDPHLHEAVSHTEGAGDKEMVVDELQSGYQLGDQVIRHAMVRVES